LLDGRDRLAVHRQDHVAGLDPGPLRGARDVLDHQSHVQPRGLPLLRRQRAHGDAEPPLAALGRLLRYRLGAGRKFGEHCGERLALALAHHVERHAVARLRAAHDRGEVARALDALAVEREHHVARAQSGLLGRAARRHAGDQRAARAVELERLGQALVQLLHRDAEPSVPHAAGGEDLVLDANRHVDRDREGQALVAAGARIDLRVDADHAAARVEQRPARVARVHRDVGLDERHVGVARQRASLGADDAGGRALLEAERRADRQHVVADGELRGVAQLHHRQTAGRDAQHRDVGCGIDAEHFRLEFAAVGELHRHAARVAHHVRIGEDQAVVADDESGPLAVHRRVAARRRRDRQPAIEAEERIVVEIGGALARRGNRALDGDADHGRAETLEDRPVIGRADRRDETGGCVAGGGRRCARGRRRGSREPVGRVQAPAPGGAGAGQASSGQCCNQRVSIHPWIPGVRGGQRPFAAR